MSFGDAGGPGDGDLDLKPPFGTVEYIFGIARERIGAFALAAELLVVDTVLFVTAAPLPRLGLPSDNLGVFAFESFVAVSTFLLAFGVTETTGTFITSVLREVASPRTDLDESFSASVFLGLDGADCGRGCFLERAVNRSTLESLLNSLKVVIDLINGVSMLSLLSSNLRGK